MADDLVASAVTFLQDPKVADAPLAKRIAFLESKGLSPQQVQQALQRAQEQQAVPSNEQTGYAPARPPTLPYASYAQGGQTQQALIAPPPLPQRDWRDWFIMAVVSGGFSWAVYQTAKRYVLPLVQPPNVSQLEDDKTALAAQFDQVQEMLTMLQSDAAEQKQQLADQKTQVDKCLSTVTETVDEVRDKTARRETDIRRLGLELDEIRALIPKALEGVKQAQTDSLNELNNELRSLKTLLQNRTKAQGGYTPVPAPAQAPSASATSATLAGKAPITSTKSPSQASIDGTASSTASARPLNDTLSRFTSGSAAGSGGIPAWQLSAPEPAPAPASKEAST